MENSLARELTIAESKIQYDEQVKKVLAEKEILAWILKNVTKEFSDMSIEKIQTLIEDEPKISEVRVNPGETNAEVCRAGGEVCIAERDEKRSRITGLSNEDKVPEEGVIYYDIRFQAFYPLESRYVKVIMNVEAQKSYYPGYRIPTRGIFYCARMLSAQLDTEFTIPEYDGLKKVYSIWVCMNAPDYIGNAISMYSIKKEDFISGIVESDLAYDKLAVVQICLSEKQESETDFLKMLNVLLSKSKRAEEKKRILETEFQIKMNQRLKKEVNVMCNLSDWVEEEGIKKGEYNKMCEVIQKLQKRMSVEEIAEVIEEPVETVREIIEKFESKDK